MKSQDQPATSKGASTRERILISARKQLVERGYEAFVMRELAESLGIKLGNLQYYFKTRESLVFHIIEAEAAKDVQAIESHLQSSDSPLDAFVSVVRDLVIRWRGSTGILFSTLTALSMHNAGFRKLYRDIYVRFYAALEEIVGELNPTLPDAEIALRVRMITSLIDGSSMQVQVGDKTRYLECVQRQAQAIAVA